MKRPVKLTRRQKEICRINGLNPAEWLLVVENELSLRIIRKDTVDTEFPKYKCIDKNGRRKINGNNKN